jgi:hypothetical protein
VLRIWVNPRAPSGTQGCVQIPDIASSDRTKEGADVRATKVAPYRQRKTPREIAGRLESGNFPTFEGTFLVNHAAHAASLALADDIGIASVAPEDAA